ncbi:N-acetylglucosamine-6-phosphate deacetylase [Gorillibacterium sp. sgz5001074]|uniref:N-acetylglucosamine-6-phosphate deacetylase n=1 Tax=Gorillibacterium sp. sgz5001074 TaxID=3446695 RepID=UPI003F6651F2
MRQQVVHNVQAVLPKGILPSASVWIREGAIERIDEGRTVDLHGCLEVIDGEGGLLVPGMIDVHIHGANGFDMMDGTEESIQQVSRACAATGCTSFLATSVSSSLEDLLSMVRSVRKVVGSEDGAKLAGLHLEGPYLNPKRKGMQNEKFLRHPDLLEMERILLEADGLIRMVTIAPELPGGLELVTYLKQKGIIVSIAHSDATYEEAKDAFKAGASHITHCFNGMCPIHHRNPGLIVAAFEEEHVSLQAIVDYVHLHPAIVRLMYRLKGADNMVLITDALQAMGLGDGRYLFGGHHVTVADGTARLQDGTLASSTVTMNQALRYAVELGISLPDAVRMASSTPASILGMNNTGSIIPGLDADLVLLDKDYSVKWTMVKGNRIG